MSNSEGSEDSSELQESCFSILVTEQDGQNDSKKLIITKGQDNLNRLFIDYKYHTISESSQLNDSYEPSSHDESQILLNQSFVKQNKDDIKETEIGEIEQSLVLTLKQAEYISDLIEKCCSQEETSISTYFSQLSNNKNLLKSIIGLDKEEDLEIITMLIMLLIIQNPTPDFLKQEEQFDIHMEILFLIHTSYRDYCKIQEKSNVQNEDEVTKELEFVLEKDFRTQLIAKLR